MLLAEQYSLISVLIAILVILLIVYLIRRL